MVPPKKNTTKKGKKTEKEIILKDIPEWYGGADNKEEIKEKLIEEVKTLDGSIDSESYKETREKIEDEKNKEYPWYIPSREAMKAIQEPTIMIRENGEIRLGKAEDLKDKNDWYTIRSRQDNIILLDYDQTKIRPYIKDILNRQGTFL